MNNPWNDIVFPNEDFVHPEDRQIWKRPGILPPQPYLGSFEDGRVMWLLGGFSIGDEMAIDHPEHRPTVLKWARTNLESPMPSTPNLWIGADCVDSSFVDRRDVKWWRKATGQLFQAMVPALGEKNALQTLANNLFVLEAFPYPAKTRPVNKRLPTHEFTAHLLSAWLSTNRPVVMGRGEKFWRLLVPEMDAAFRRNQVMRVKNVQSASISPGNLSGGSPSFEFIVASLLSTAVNSCQLVKKTV